MQYSERTISKSIALSFAILQSSPMQSSTMAIQRLRRLATAPLLSDRGLLRALRSELSHELASQTRQEPILPSGFSLEHDAPRSQDVLLRRWDASSDEEVLVSALLGPLQFSGEEAPSQEVHMKVCVHKPAFGPVVRLDCSVFDNEGGDSSDFNVRGAWYHSSVNESVIKRKYLGPNTLDPKLQWAFKEYLVSRGVTTELTDFLVKHLHNKEQGQYVNWLRILEAAFAKHS